MEINYQFRERLSQVHRKGRRNAELLPQADELAFADGLVITVPQDADEVMLHAARDLEDYFFVSMGVSARVAVEGSAPDAAQVIAYGVDQTLKGNSYRLTVTDAGVRLTGSDSRMAAQAGYYIEDLMNLREAPFLKCEDTVREALYLPRMAHSGYGLDMYPTEHLVALAHQGVTAILVFIKGVDSTPHGYHDFNDLCRRAAAYGVDVYAYSYLQNRMHPDDEGAEEFYEKLYGGFFDRCPYFKGIVFVGESCEFPSKDEHTTKIRRLDNRGPDGKPLVTGKPNPGWWPCYDYPDLLNMLKRIIRRRCPDLDIVFWSYNWNRAPYEARRALIDSLPKDISLQATFEMGETPVREGFPHRVADYTLYFVGPGYYFSSESKAAAENGLRFYAMTNTGARTWDIGCAPYLPVPYRMLERYRGMRAAHDNDALHGTMEGHHYGFYPSFMTELAKWAFFAPTPDLEMILARMVERDFSPAARDKVLAAYRLFGEAMDHTPATDHEQYGPLRMGPAYPFFLYEQVKEKIPTVPYAHHGGDIITFSTYGHTWSRLDHMYQDEQLLAVFMHELKGFYLAERLYTEGLALLDEALTLTPAHKREEAARVRGIAEFIRNTYRTTVHIKEFYLRKLRLRDTHGAERNTLVREMLEICRAECENAEATIPVVQADSALGYEPSMEYMCDADHILWKLSLLRDMMEKELPSYFEET